LANLPDQFQGLPDSFLGLGPYGGILSAFREDPNAAWLVIACDLPLLSEKSLRQLLAARNPSAMATAFQSPDNEFPEPLIAIWEPRAYPVLLDFLSRGYSCPRKVLINSDAHLVQATDAAELTNVNVPEEYEAIKAALGRGQK
jgi:molybdopterin-guanine dinucleotide biosynthesis protein A